MEQTAEDVSRHKAKHLWARAWGTQRRTADQEATRTDPYSRLWGYEDGAAEMARLKGWLALAGACTTTLFLGLFLWQLCTKEQFVPMVQPVQISNTGKVELVGEPEDLLKWQPPDTVYADMLRDWVQRRYWRTQDEVLAAAEQHWVKMHTCGEGTARMTLEDAKDDPVPRTARRVQMSVGQVRQLAVAKDRRSQQWHVEWTEIETYGHMPAKEQRYSAQFMVTRVKPTTREWFAQNRAGLCVMAYSGKEAL